MNWAGLAEGFGALVTIVGGLLPVVALHPAMRREESEGDDVARQVRRMKRDLKSVRRRVR